MAAAPDRLFPWGPGRMSYYFRSCLQFAPVASGEAGALRSTLLFCLENTLMCILLGNLVSRWGRDYDKGRGMALYSRVTGIRVILWKTKRRQGSWEKKNGLGKKSVLESQGHSIELCPPFHSKLFTVTYCALELLSHA